MDVWGRLIRWIGWINRGILGFCGFLVICLVLLTFEQVIARYFFDASSVAMQELEWHLFGMIFLLAAAGTLQYGGHVRVDIVFQRLSRSWQRRIEIGGYLMFLVPMTLVLITTGLDFTLQSLDYTSPKPDDYLSALWFGKDSLFYPMVAWFESGLRSLVLIGESSPDPGGLEARWLMKAMIPLGSLLLLLQGMSEIIRLIREPK